jgi:hypothetical protein
MWTGTVVFREAGSCFWAGDPATEVEMSWSVGSSGTVTIAERYPQTPSAAGASWSGTVTDDLRVSLTKTRITSCSDLPNTVITSYSGLIRSDGGTYRLELEAVEEWCPPTCRFRSTYAVSKRR